MVEVAPLAFMRGRTLNDSFIILDEAQNTTPEQMKMFLTRLGFGSRVVVTGDVTQIDLPRGQRSGLIEVREMLEGVAGHRVRALRPPGRRAPPARAAHRRGLPRDAERAGGERRRDAVEVENRSGERRRGRAAALVDRVAGRAGVATATREVAISSSGPTRWARSTASTAASAEADRRAGVPDRRRDELPTGLPRQLGDVVICLRCRQAGERHAPAPADAARPRRCCTCSATTTRSMTGDAGAAGPAGGRARRGGMAQRDPAAAASRPRRRRGAARGARPTRSSRRSTTRSRASSTSLRTQRNMRIHFARRGGRARDRGSRSASPAVELLALMVAIALVIVAEMFNTAIEAAIDVATTTLRPARQGREGRRGRRGAGGGRRTRSAVGYLGLRRPARVDRRDGARRACATSPRAPDGHRAGRW